MGPLLVLRGCLAELVYLLKSADVSIQNKFKYAIDYKAWISTWDVLMSLDFLQLSFLYLLGLSNSVGVGLRLQQADATDLIVQVGSSHSGPHVGS